MKRMALFVVAVLAVCIAVCAQKSGNSGGKKVLVAYFSATGTTEKVARQLAEATGGVLCEIRPVKEYTSGDLDWRNKSSRSSVEMADSKSRPAFSADLDNPAGYDTVMESYDFTGKTLIPFATSGGSGISNAGKDLRKTYPDMKWQEGKLLNGSTEEEIKEWIKNK